MPITKPLLLALALSTPLHAQDIKIVGTLEQNVKISHHHFSATRPHSIKLLKVELSKPAEQALTKRTSLVTSKKVSNEANNTSTAV